MPSNQQITNTLRAVFAKTISAVKPSKGLRGRARGDDLASDPRVRERRAWLRVRTGTVGAAAAVVVAGAISVIAVASVHRRSGDRPTAAKDVPVGTVRIAVMTPDPYGGLPWGVRTIQTGRMSACLQVGRVFSDRLGTLVPANHLGIGTPVPGGRSAFLPISVHDNFPCGGTDGAGNLFLDVISHEHPAGDNTGTRDIAYGVLGPDAIAVSYLRHGRTVTERTGPDGAYIAVLPGTSALCTTGICFGGNSPSETTTSTVQYGIITSVRYRNGRVCRLETTRAPRTGAPSCQNVGYVR